MPPVESGVDDDDDYGDDGDDDDDDDDDGIDDGDDDDDDDDDDGGGGGGGDDLAVFESIHPSIRPPTDLIKVRIQLRRAPSRRLRSVGKN